MLSGQTNTTSEHAGEGTREAEVSEEEEGGGT